MAPGPAMGTRMMPQGGGHPGGVVPIAPGPMQGFRGGAHRAPRGRYALIKTDDLTRKNKMSDMITPQTCPELEGSTPL
eukprot:6809426-Pyramimonas_sp.AAC.1